jgi:hypothetical protein
LEENNESSTERRAPSLERCYEIVALRAIAPKTLTVAISRSSRISDMYRIPITLQFRDGESVVSAIYFPTEPSAEQADEVCKAAAELGKSRGAMRVLVPAPWCRPGNR